MLISLTAFMPVQRSREMQITVSSQVFSENSLLLAGNQWDEGQQKQQCTAPATLSRKRYTEYSTSFNQYNIHHYAI